jgi:hypothetical protein
LFIHLIYVKDWLRPVSRTAKEAEFAKKFKNIIVNGIGEKL